MTERIDSEAMRSNLPANAESRLAQNADTDYTEDSTASFLDVSQPQEEEDLWRVAESLITDPAGQSGTEENCAIRQPPHSYASLLVLNVGYLSCWQASWCECFLRSMAWSSPCQLSWSISITEDVQTLSGR